MLLTLRIQLAHISKPPVWRQITVPGEFTFHKLHKVIQEVFGWEDYHLYQFSEKGYRSETFIGIPSDDGWQETKDSRKIKLQQVFTKKGQKYTYSDDWLHNILIEKITDEKEKRAGLIAGKGRCPPEDCGGPGGYERLKEIVNNPEDPEYEEIREWLGMAQDDIYDPEFFDLKSGQKVLGYLK